MKTMSPPTLPALAMAATLLSTLALSSGARADEGGSCHFHGNKPAAEATVLGCATKYKDKLIATGKLDKSWQGVTQPDKVEQVEGKRNKEWKLSFKNPAAADPSKHTLYLFYTLPGNFIAANHTGK